MNNLINKLKNNFLVIYIILNLSYILIGSYLVYNLFLEYITFSYGYIILLVINVLIILILFFKKKYIKNIIDIFLVLIIIFAIISTIFAYNQNKALFGEYIRYEGLFTICYYITLLFISSFIKKEKRKYIVNAILIFGLVQCLYSYCQKFALFNVKTRIDQGYRWAVGFTGNRNFFGSLMVICIGYSMSLYLKSKDKINIGLYLLLTFLFCVGILFSKTRSCFISLIFMIIILLIYSIKNKNIIKYIVLILILGILLQVLNFEPMSRFSINTNTTSQNISNNKSNENFSSNRIKLWKQTIEVVPKYLVHGVGIDNFANIIDGRAIRGPKSYYDKAHNEYLQILVTMGLFSLISYLSLHFLAIKNGIKNKEIYLALPIIGYIIQSQFNISVIEVAPIFYIALGLSINRE